MCLELVLPALESEWSTRDLLVGLGVGVVVGAGVGRVGVGVLSHSLASRTGVGVLGGALVALADRGVPNPDFSPPPPAPRDLD